MKVEPEIGRSVAIENVDPHENASPRARSFARHAVNIAFIVAAIVVSFWRVFLLGETLIDVNTLNNQLPWGYSAGQSDYPYNRRDLTDTYVTREYFVASAYADGEFPLWNPYTMAGHPIYADGVTRTLSPFLFYYKIFDVPLGYSLARISELILAAVFMYFFLAAIGAGANGALMGSLVFGFSAHSMLHLTGLGWWGGLMWLPLILLFVDRAIRRNSFLNALLAGVCLAAQFFCGYLPNQIYYVGAAVLYYLFFGFFRRGAVEMKPRVFRALAMMVVTLSVGFAISATQWVPALELLSHSNRKIVGAELGYVWLPPWYAATLIFPNLFGEAYDANMLRLFTAIGVSHDHILYLGLGALVPLGFSLFWLKRTGRRRGNENLLQVSSLGFTRNHCVFFAFLTACSLIMMMAAPLYVPLTRHVPILQVIRVPVRAGVLFLLAAAALAAFGTDLLFKSAQEELRRFATIAKRVAVCVAAFTLLAVLASYSLKLTGFAAESSERGKMAFIRRSALALTGQFTPPNLDVLIPLALLCLAAVLIWLFAAGRVNGRVLFGCLVAMLVIDLSWVGTQFNRTFDRSRVFPKTEVTELLQSLPPGRVLVVPSDLESNRRVDESTARKIIAPPNTLLPYQISSVTGKNQQFPRWYREFASLIEPQPNLSHVVFDEYYSRYFNLLNVRYVMTHQSAARLGEYDLLATAEGISLYENKDAMPRAFFVNQIVEVGSHAEALRLLTESTFDPRASAVIELNANGKAAETGKSVGVSGNRAVRLSPLFRETRLPVAPDIVAITEDKRNRVTIRTESVTDGLLVLSDNYYPGWRAFVDGSTAEILRANCTMRALKVPSGHHVISFVFAPATFFVSLYISIAAAVLTLFALILAAAKRKSETSHDLRQNNKDS